MYTRIPNEKGALSAAETWKLYRDRFCPRHLITPEIIKDALLVVLTNNVFEFYGGLYRQIRGTAIGSACSIVYANCFMGRFFATQRK